MFAFLYPLELQILLKLKCVYCCLCVHIRTLDGPLIINGINTQIITVGVGQLIDYYFYSERAV